MVTKKKVTKKLGRRWYKNDPAIISSIQHCIDLGFTTKDSIKYLFTLHGCEMHERSFRRIKKSLPASNTQRLEIISNETTTFFHESLGDMRTSKNELMKTITDPNTSIAIKIHASTALTRTLITMAEFHDSTPIITLLSKLKGGMENTFQKPEDISRKKLP